MLERPLLLCLDAGITPAARFSLDGLTRWLAGPHWRPLAVLALFCLVCFLPGMSSIPPVDRDEARFTQASKQMLESGNYMDIRFQEGTRYKKPIGIYWLQSAAARVTGHGPEAPIWVYRLPSLLGAIAAVLLTYWAGLALFGRTASFFAAAALAAAPLLLVEAHLAKTDAVLLATVVLTMGSLARLYLAEPGKAKLVNALGFWIGLGLGTLVKGPIVPMVAGLAIPALAIVDRRATWLRGLRPMIGVPVFAVIVLPWFVSILMLAGEDFLRESVGKDLMGKVAAAAEGHGAPPGTHLLLFFLLAAPAAMLAPASLGWLRRQWAEPSVRFCLAWAVPTFLVFEAIVTKLPHYPLPTYPAACLLIGATAAAGGLSSGRILRRLPLVAIAATVALVAAGLWFLAWDGVLGPSAALAGLVTLGLAAVAGRLAWRGEALPALAVQIVGAIPFALLIFGAVLPQAGTHMLTPRLAAALDRIVTCPDRQLATAGYQEASVLLTLGTETRFVEAEGAAEFLAAGGCRVALVDDRREPAFLTAAAKAGLKVDKRDTVEGLNIGRVSMVRVALYTAGNAP